MNAPTTQSQRILAQLEAYGPLPTADLAEMLPDIPRASLEVACSKLRAKRKIDRCEKGWFIGDPGEPGAPPPAAPPLPHEQPREALIARPEQLVDLAGRVAVESTTSSGTQAPYRVGDEHPVPPVEQQPQPKRAGRETPGGVSWVGPGNPPKLVEVEMPAFVFHVKTKSLRVSITGDEADALAAIRAVAEALEDQARRAKP